MRFVSPKYNFNLMLMGKISNFYFWIMHAWSLVEINSNPVCVWALNEKMAKSHITEHDKPIILTVSPPYIRTIYFHYFRY